jgi:UDP-N-acetylmuramate dehydrogenase
MVPAYHLAESVSLAARNGFRVAARAEVFIDVRRIEALPELFSMPYLQRSPLLVLGEGSNTLIVGDVPGVVMAIGIMGRDVLASDDHAGLLRVGAGERWDDVVAWSLGLGYAGLENLVLIPGLAGAAPIQNIGAYGTEAGEFIETVEAWDRRSARLVRLGRTDCGYGYRDSVFKRDPSRWLVTAIELRLPRGHAPRIDYPGLREELAALGASKPPRPAQIAEAVSRLRTRKLPNPALVPNVGSFFRNPVVSIEHARQLQAEAPTLPAWEVDHGRSRKLSAAWLIEHAGWKGVREGDAGVSAQHALVLVNHGQASGAQMFELAQRIAVSVRDRFGVWLEPEARIVGARWDTPDVPATAVAVSG